jgi:hypothetical protein
MNLAPIILFVYNRPWHTRQTLSALQQNELASQSILYVYADGAKVGASKDDLKAIEETRAVSAEDKWCGEVHIIEREINYGLAENVIAGISEVINNHGKIIVLEDDLVTSPFFLTYCNSGLDIYKNEKHVYSINAFQFPLEIDAIDTFLSPQATSSWGWATWKDRWVVFECENIEKELIIGNNCLKTRFDISDNNKSSILYNKNSWAIKWYYSVFIRNGLGLFPTKSLVCNIGFDNTGVHCGEVNFEQNIFPNNVKLIKHDKINLFYYSLVFDWFTTQKESPKTNSVFENKLIYFIKNAIKKIKLFGE